MTIDEIHTYGKAYNAILECLAPSGMTNREYRHLITLYLDEAQLLPQVNALLKTKPKTKLRHEALRILFVTYLAHINPRCSKCKARITPPLPCNRCKVLARQKTLDAIVTKKLNLRFGQ